MAIAKDGVVGGFDGLEILVWLEEGASGKSDEDADVKGEASRRHSHARHHQRRIRPLVPQMRPSTNSPVVEHRYLFTSFSSSPSPLTVRLSPAVANSGGPDSTCLLFLIHRYLSRNSTFPQAVVSLTVDHDLQASSSAMADHCAKVARSLGVRHLSTRIPWSTPPFPPRPEPGEMFENTARDARYHSLFQLMTRENIPVIAFGHHADDQVETALMRLGRGSTKLGAAGMRPCRRWGMGMLSDENALGYAGYEGMNRWIVRPLLLDVGKVISIHLE